MKPLAPNTMTADKAYAIASSLVAHALVNKGGTQWFDPWGKQHGYVVALHRNVSEIVIRWVGHCQTVALVQHYILTKMNVDGIICDGIGIWVNEDEGGALYLDCVYHVDNITHAMEMARTNEQLAIYDLTRNEVINVK